jgi:ABC-type cobalamin/Fe3+-siderophores transport system ATPase subunit
MPYVPLVTCVVSFIFAVTVLDQYLARRKPYQLRADLIILDEPATGLDAGGRELYLQAVAEELHRGAAIVMATHDIQEEAALCRQVMLMARRVVALGAPQDVLTPEALLRTFGIVVTGGKRLQVIETQHGHGSSEHSDPDKEGD